MQSLSEIRELLEQSGLSPRKQFGQNFLIDHNLMGKLLELADVLPDVPVLEVGPGTGSLTEELLRLASKVVAVEIDRGLGELLQTRLNEPNFRLIRGDVLADKRHISPEVLSELGPVAQMVSNLPYSIATPLVAQCLLDSWTACSRTVFGEKETGETGTGEMGTGSFFRRLKKGACPLFTDKTSEENGDRHLFPNDNSGKRSQSPFSSQSPSSGLTCFRRLTFTVQREVADRLVAGAGDEAYGPVSVVVALLSLARPGPVLPASAFWPRPAVESQMVRLDFDPERAGLIRDISVLTGVLTLSFSQRRKQLGSIFRRSTAFRPEALMAGAEQSGIDLTCRAEDLSAETFLKLSNLLVDL